MSTNVISQLVKKYWIDIILTVVIFCTLPLFFYKLGASSLVSFDEAWYADISRNILKTGNLLDLKWNGNNFIDHPQGGFWLIALSYLTFGVNEFSARFSQAFLGFLTLIFLYLLGRKLFNRLVGFTSALALASSPWFIFRARSGNLDSILVFFFVVTVYFSFKLTENKIFFVPFLLSLVMSLLIKTAVGFTLLPVVVFILFGFRTRKIKNYNQVVTKVLALFILIIGIWFVYQSIVNTGFLYHYFKIGLPGVKAETSVKDNLLLMKNYLHSGIGKWFWPGIAATLLGLLTFQKRFMLFTLFFVFFFTPFLFSAKGHVWQLIPLHPFLILSFFGLFWVLLNKTFEISLGLLAKFKSTKKANPQIKLVKLPAITLVLLVVCLYFTIPQTLRNWREFIDIPTFITDEAILSREAGKYQENLYIDEAFLPTAIFYSQKKVTQIQGEEIKYIFEKVEPFVLITHEWRLEQSGIKGTSFEVLKKDRDKILLKRQI